MTNAPSTRQTHVVRMVGTNANGDVLQDIWVDLERIDIAKSASQAPGSQWTGVQRKLLWMDDPTADNYNPDGNPARKIAILKVCSPDEPDVTNPTEWVNVPVIRSMKSSGGGQDSMDRNRNNIPGIDDDIFNQARVVSARRIFHYDTNIDTAAQAAFDADPTLKAYVVKGSDYTRDESSKDDTQYVEHEIITFFKPASNNLDVMGQDQQVKLLNQYLIDESAPATLAITGNNGLNPPYRLDPFQNIVNVNFAFNVYVIIVACTGDFAVAKSDSVKIIDRQSSDPALVIGGDGSPVTATLIQCSANAGADFVELQTSLISGPLDNSEKVYAIVCPKTDDVKANWFEDYVVNFYSAGSTVTPPTKPFLWILSGILMGAPTLMKFKIRYAPHLSHPSPGAKDKMVQMYPTTGNNVYAGNSFGNSIAGWAVQAYRTDKAGTGPLFGIPPEWNTDNIIYFSGVPAGTGLLFGKDPPLIAGDVPYAF